MANSLSASFPEIWARQMQTVFHKTNVAMKVADVSFKSQMSRGDTLNRPYRGDLSVQAYTRGTSITIDDITDTNEALTINSEYATGFYIDDYDKIQSNYDSAMEYGSDAGIRLSNQVDASVLGEYGNATSTVDDGDVGGTSGNAIALTTSNVLAVIGAAKRKILKQNVPAENLKGIISPEFEEILVQYGAGRDTANGDTVQDNGFFTNFYGFKLYRSNQLACSALLSMATEPTASDTVVIEGVTFTFVASPSAAGDIDLSGTVDTTRGYLVNLINNPGTTSATQIALSAANQRVFANITATHDTSADTVAVVAKGVGVLNVSETFTDATDAWTATKTAQHNLFCAGSAPTLVMQSEPSIRVRDVETKLGANVLNGVLYGVKTFSDNAKRMVDVQIKASSFS